MNSSIVLPTWLDSLIYETLGGRYARMSRDLVVLQWDQAMIQGYLGTYFPRSYVEAYCIFSAFFTTHRDRYASRAELSVFDFGCGTGGELVGLIVAMRECLPHIRHLSIHALDGNQYALRYMEQILTATGAVVGVDITLRVIPVVIDDFYDMTLVERVLRESYDLILTFKAVCEFVTMQQFEQKNAYEHILQTFLPHMSDGGVMCIADITTYSEVSAEWLPQMLDRAAECVPVTVVARNEGYNTMFCVTHSRCTDDVSKIAYRIYTKRE